MAETTMSQSSPLRVDLDKPVPKRAIRVLTKIIAEKFNPEKIILFGSYAYGQPKPWSDVDLLIVMDTPNGEWPLIEAIWDALPPCSFGVDVLVRSQAEIDRRIAINDWFLQEITAKGKVLYARDHRRVGREGRKRLRRRAPAHATAGRRATHR